MFQQCFGIKFASLKGFLWLWEKKRWQTQSIWPISLGFMRASTDQAQKNLLFSLYWYLSCRGEYKSELSSLRGYRCPGPSNVLDYTGLSREWSGPSNYSKEKPGPGQGFSSTVPVVTKFTWGIWTPPPSTRMFSVSQFCSTTILVTVLWTLR